MQILMVNSFVSDEVYTNEQTFDELIEGLIAETVRERSVGQKILMNCWPFIKYVKFFHPQTVALYSI